MNANDETGDGEHSSAGTRGVVEVFGVALLLGIVVLGVALLLVLGGSSLADSEQAIEVTQAERSLTQLDAHASRVALGEEPVQRVDLGFAENDGSLDVNESSGRFRVDLVDGNNGTTEEVVNTSLGAVTYRNGETAVAYQGGGVWRHDGDGSVMVSRPEFHYRNATLTVPVVRIADGEPVHSAVQITKGGATIRRHPNRSAGWENKLSNQKGRVTVRSPYYEAWGRFFEESTAGLVRYNHDDNEVVLTLLALPNTIRPRNGVIATSGPGRLALKGTGAYVDSYNSSQGDYGSTASDNGTVEAVGDVNITGDGEIAGTVRSGSAVDVDSSSGKIDGDVYWTDDFENAGTVTGSDEQIDGVAAVEPIDGYVAAKVRNASRSNNNSETPHISDNELSLSGSSGEIEAGTYYLENLNLDGEELVLNTTDGDVTIGVQDWVKITRSGGTTGRITVEGNGTVRLFLAGKSETTVSPTGLGEQEVNLYTGKNTVVEAPGDRSRQLRILAKRDLNATIAGSSGKQAKFVGTIYAPAGEYGSGFVYAKQTDIYGAVVTGNLTLGQHGAIHFDRGLRKQSFPQSPTVSRLEYLHVSVRPLEIKNE